MKTRMKPSTFANKTSLTLAVAETTIKIANCFCGDHWATVTQRLKGPAVTLTRTFDATDDQDWAVLKLEAKALGVDLVKERDLHQFAARFQAFLRFPLQHQRVAGGLWRLQFGTGPNHPTHPHHPNLLVHASDVLRHQASNRSSAFSTCGIHRQSAHPSTEKAHTSAANQPRSQQVSSKPIASR